jgi:serine protease Do
MDGDVIGVNTAIISPTGGSIGIGFAVPSDTAVNVIEQLRLYGETRRGWLGVRIQSISEDIASSLGVDAKKGALVAAVDTDSPAALSGLKNGDVILRFDGKEIMTMRGLPRIVAQTPIGKSVPVEILRDGKPMTLSVEVGRLNEADASSEAEEKTETDDKSETSTGPAIAGLSVSVMSDELRKKYSLGVQTSGLVVTAVEESSPAAKKNIREGDVIVEVGQEKVETVEALEKAVERVRKSGRKAVLLRIETPRGDLRFVAVPLK